MSCIFRLKRIAVAPLALLAGLSACAGAPPVDAEGDQDPVDIAVAAADLGVAIDGCADGGSTGWVAASGTLTLTLSTDPGEDVLVLSAPGGKIAANGNLCTGTVNTVAGTQLTTANVSKLAVVGSTNADKVIIDLLPGTFGTKILSARGGISVDFTPVNGSGVDSLMIRGGASAEKFKVGETAAGDIYAELTGDKNADVKVATGATPPTVSISMGASADTFTGSPAATDVTAFSGTTIALVPLTSNATVYGGTGNDTLTGGAGDDVLNGGDNDDTFKMAATSDGADVYSGDNGTDTVDYSNRTAAVTVDVGANKPTLVGSVDLSGLTYSNLDAKILNFAVNGTATTVTFASTSSPANIVSQINTAFDNTGATFVATLTGENKLKMYASASIAILPGNAAAVLGISGVSGTKAPMVGNVDLASGGVTTETLDLTVDGEACAQITFANEADTTAIAAAINGAGACNATVASVQTVGAVEYLVLQSPTASADASVEIVNSAAAATALGLVTDVPTVSSTHDKDDGLASEKDDVRYSVENVTGGTAADLLIGSDLKNVLKGGGGNDKLEGGANASCTALNADSLLGEAGDDSFFVPVSNCFVVLNGSTGTDTANYSARSAVLTLSNDSVALDGDSTEKGNIDKTIEVLVGGFGGDTLTGGASNDTLRGGAGDDILNGAGGNDTMIGGTGGDVMNGGPGSDDIVDYSSYTAAIDVTLCDAPAAATGTSADCGAADDGDSGTETDQILNVEHVIGGGGNDDIAASTTAVVSVKLEGGAGTDNLTGGPGDDTLYGDNGNDVLRGGAGEDFLEGGVGDDDLRGEGGDGDICISNADDATHPVQTCEG